MTATIETYICPTCQNENPNRYRYCRACHCQTRCFSCGELLEPGAKMCFVCSEPVRAITTNAVSPNAYSLREHTKTGADGSQEHSLEIELRVATEGLEHVGALYGVASTGGYRRQSTVTPVGRPPVAALVDGRSVPIDDTDLQQPALRDALPAPASALQDDLLAPIRPHFHRVGDDDVVCSIANFRGKSNKENQCRFMVLYTLAYQDTLGHKLDRDKVRAALEKKGLLDKNYTTYLNEIHQKYFVEAGEAYVLTEVGRQYLNDILESLAASQDESVDMPKPRRTLKPSNNRYSSEQADIVNKMVDAAAWLPNFTLPDDWTPRHYGALALWLMSQVLDGPGASSPRMAAEFLNKLLHGRFPYANAAISEGFNKRNKGFFRPNSQGLFMLTDEGTRFIESYLAESGYQNILERVRVIQATT